MSEKRRAKAHKLLKNSDPVINPLNYRESFLHFIQYLNQTYDDKQRMEWIRGRFPKVKFKDVHSLEFRTLSTSVS